MSKTYKSLGIELEETSCCACGITFAAPHSFLEAFRTGNHDGCFYCPNGHKLSWRGNTELDAMRKRAVALQATIDQKNAEIARKSAAIEEERRRTIELDRSLKAQKGVVTRIKNRAAAGVCPCCNRTFTQLARHMQAKHKEFIKENGVPEVQK